MTSWLKDTLRRFKKWLVALLLVGTALGAPSETFVSAHDRVLFDTRSGNLNRNQYALDLTENQYYVHWSDGQMTREPADWDKRTRTDVVWDEVKEEEKEVNFRNRRRFTQKQVDGRDYIAYYQSRITKQRTKTTFSEEQYRNLAKKDARAPLRNLLNTAISTVNAAVTLNAVSTSTAAGWGTSMTFAHTVAGTETVLTVGSGYKKNTDQTSGITYNGDDMTDAGGVYNSSQTGGDVYYLIAPDDGTANVVITLGAGQNDRHGHACSFNAAHQTTQPHATSSYEGFPNSDTDYTASFTTTVDGTYGCDITAVSDTTADITADAGQTVDYEDIVATFSVLAGSREAQASQGAFATTYQNDLAFKGAFILNIIVEPAEEAATDSPRRRGSIISKVVDKFLSPVYATDY